MRGTSHGIAERAFSRLPLRALTVIFAALQAMTVLSPRTALADDLSVFNAASQSAAEIRDLFYMVFGITGAIFVLVEAILIYSIFRFRSRRAAHTAEPAQVYGSQPLEVAWTVAPLLIVFVLALVVFRSIVAAQEDTREDQPQRTQVRVVGHQWWWDYEYRDLGFRAPNELHVPVASDSVVAGASLQLESADVIHSFWVPRLAGKTDLIPGRTNLMWFDVTEPGVYHGQCAEFCGAQHANMKLLVIAEPHEEFLRWAENQKQNAVNDPTVTAGRERFLALACVTCHAIRGTTAVGTVGPDLTHLMSRRTLAAGAAKNDRDNLSKWLKDPDAIKPLSLMPNMQLGDDDVALLVSYLETLK